MIYIICALEAEAAHFIQYYSLQKEADNYFPLFSQKDVKLIISGIGKINASAACTYLLQKYPHQSPKVFNIGTCASTQDSHAIGTLHPIRKLIDKSTNNAYHIATEGEALSCVDIACTSGKDLKTPLVDMESVAIYLAAKRFSKDICILKIVSDFCARKIPNKTSIQALFKAQENTLKGYLNV